MDRKDPKGFYAILQVAPNASAALIKAAYRHRAMELHPDRNKSASATTEFQLLTRAYHQLSDPKLRATYDTQSAVGEPDQSGTAGKSAKTPAPEFIACSRCSKISAQPRYVVFWEVKSFVFLTQRSPIQGIFCPTCAERSAFRATAVTWLLGWWGIPWGPLYSIGALFTNAFGGEKPALINAKILTHQCFAFGFQGQTQMAIGIAREAKKFAMKVPKSEPIRDSLIADLDKVLATGAPNMPALVDGWRLWNRPFYVQGAALALVGILLGAWIYDGNADRNGSGYAAISSPKPRGSSVSRSPVAPKPKYVRSATAPNGAPWPTAAGYIDGYKKKNNKGLSTITIDNTQSDSDVFVKVMALNGAEAKPVRLFFIPAFGQFTATKLTKGNYRVEYEDLGTGRKYRGDTFQAEEIPMPGGVQYSEDSLTLYKVQNGNVTLAEIDDTDFNSGIDGSPEAPDRLAQQ